MALAGVALALPVRADAAVQARPADAFVDSIGVNVHTAYNDTPYVPEFATVEQRLGELGVRHVRDELRDFPDRAGQYERLNQLAADGFGSTLVVGSPVDGIDGLEALLGIAADELDGVEALEGPNEYSTSGDPEWQPHLLTYQQALYEQAKADPALVDLPLVGPSIVHNDQAQLGDVSAWLDSGNTHSYPFGNPPDKLGAAIAKAELNSAQKPIWATETGYHTALNWTGEHPPVSEATMTTYVPRLFLEYFRWGIVRTFSYELLDEWPDPGLDERESDFGLLRNDLAPKPAFDALRNTIAILEDPGTPFDPAALDYSLGEGGVELAGPESPGLHKLLLQKRDGSFYLVLWRTNSVWDPATGEPLAAAPAPVEVSVAPGIESATTYLPNVAAAPVWSLTRPEEPVTVEVGPAATVLRILPGAPGSKPEPEAGPGPAPGPTTATGPGPTEDQRSDGGSQPDPPPCSVPKLAGRKLGSAGERLRAAHCRLGAILGPRGRSSRVTTQHPRPGRLLAPEAPVRVKLEADA
jgi:hypothetical protein